jgi:hypothetical protein
MKTDGPVGTDFAWWLSWFKEGDNSNAVLRFRDKRVPED